MSRPRLALLVLALAAAGAFAGERRPYTAEQLTLIRDTAEARLSPDGRTVAFVSDATGARELWTVPAKGGKQGQVIHAPHDAGERRLLAPSLREMLYQLANDLEDGKYSYDEDDGLV